MPIPENHKWRYIFHFTDIRNLDSIIKNGLLCTNEKNKRGIKHHNIANMIIQERRANMDVTAGPGGKVHDYVPFYFSSLNPMLLKKLNEKNVDQPGIIYLCIKIDRLDNVDAVFTDAAANTIDPPSFYDDVADLNCLNWDLIDSKKWSVGTAGDKQKKMAEALVYQHVGIGEVDAIVVYNESARKAVEIIFSDNKMAAPTLLYDHDAQIRKYSFYYTKFFFNDRKRETLVYGPSALLSEYENLLAYIKKERLCGEVSYPYKSVSDLVGALDNNIVVLPELKDVAELLQDYDPHNDTVGEHTKKVVGEMRQLGYYKNASYERKNVLLLAAYLHDIGKGPKKKWKDGKMTGAYLDHPLDAIPMLARILTKEIEEISEEDIRDICLLVVYHDIIGDCMEKGREKQQVADVIESEDDLEMLFAISCADAKAITGAWGLNIFCRKKSFAEEIMKMKNS